jgi:poly(3-hydroxybutyrate) depolymerase
MTSSTRVRSLRTALAALAFLSVGAVAGAARAQDIYGGLEGRAFDAGGGFMLPYRLGKPPAYNPANKYPLVIFLHGSGESGTDNKLQVSKNIGTNTPGSVFTTAANQAKFPTFFIAPQTPNTTIGWKAGSTSLNAVFKLITALEAEFSIDPSRLYLTGLSMGGMGTFSAIQTNPDLFAAAIPMSGRGDPTMAPKIAKIPLWDFHGALDPSVNVSGSRDMIAALRAAGGMPRYTEYPNGMHDIWFMAYNTPDLLPWMNAQRLGALDPLVDGGWGPDAPSPGTGAAGAGADGGAAGSGGAAGTGGAAGATAGTGGGAAGTSGAAGAAAGTGGGAAGVVGTGASGTGGGGAGTGVATGAAGTGAATGAAGAPSGGTGAAGAGSAGTSGSHGGSSGGCAVASSGAGPSLLGCFVAALIAGAVRRPRRR